VSKVTNNRKADHALAWKNYVDLERDTEKKRKGNMLPHKEPNRSNKRSSTMPINNELYFREHPLQSNKSPKAKQRDKKCMMSCEKIGRIYSSNKKHKDDEEVSASIFCSGEFLVRDIPFGLDDTIKRFLRAASIRHLNPNAIPIKTLQQTCGSVEKMNLIPDLSRVALENYTWEYVEPIIKELHEIGIKIIRQFLPPSKLKSILFHSKTLRGREKSEDFIHICSSIIAALINREKMQYVSLRKKYTSLKSYLVPDRFSFSGEQKPSQITEEESKANYKYDSQYDSDICDLFGFTDDDENSLPDQLWTDCKDSSNSDEKKHRKIPNTKTFQSESFYQKKNTSTFVPVTKSDNKKTAEIQDTETSQLYTNAGIKARDMFRLDLKSKLQNDYSKDLNIFRDSTFKCESGLFPTSRKVTKVVPKDKRKSMKGKRQFVRKENDTSSYKRSWVIPYTSRIKQRARERFPTYGKMQDGS